VVDSVVLNKGQEVHTVAPATEYLPKPQGRHLTSMQSIVHVPPWSLTDTLETSMKTLPRC